MHLTRVLLFYTKLSKVPGNLYSGKHRLYKKITVRDKRAALAQLLVEQENLEILSKQYLTLEEEKNHMIDMGRAHLAFEAIKGKAMSKMLPHRTIEDHLEHVNVSRRWE